MNEVVKTLPEITELLIVIADKISEFLFNGIQTLPEIGKPLIVIADKSLEFLFKVIEMVVELILAELTRVPVAILRQSL